MKNIFTYLILAFVILIPCNVFSQNQWDVTQNLFSYVKLEKDLNSESRNAASVTYKGKIFYFISYDTDHKVVVREIVNGDSLAVNSFNPIEVAHYEILKDKVEPRSQLAPVVFNGVLYLFFNDDSGYYSGEVGYVTYDDKLQKWSAPIMYPASEKLYLDAGSVVVVDNKLCMVSYHSYTDHQPTPPYYEDVLEIRWTTDPTNLYGWTGQYAMTSDARWPYYSIQSDGGKQDVGIFTPISAISQNYLDPAGTITSQKLIVAKTSGAYTRRGPSAYAFISQYKFDTNGELTLIRKDSVLCPFWVQSVALVQGSVENDPSSTGNCTQLFVKNDNTENKYNRHRIARLQLKEGETQWTTQEDNVVPQNSPMKMWADAETNLTAVNYDLLDGDPSSTTTPIQRYIVLLYRGNTDNNHPLLSAWVKSDYLKYKQTLTQDLINDPTQCQYIGYIEGPPPYYKSNSNNTYVNSNAEGNISYVDFISSHSMIIDNKVSFTTQSSFTTHISSVSAEISYLRQQSKDTTTKITSSEGVTMHAGPENKGLYIVNAPTISLAEYYVYDWHRIKRLYSSFDFSMVITRHHLTPDLSDSLNSSDPETFMSAKRGIDFNYYPSIATFGDPSVSWSSQNSVDKNFTIEQSKDVESKTTKSLKLSSDMCKYFSSESEKTVEYTTTTITANSNSITAHSNMDNATKTGDCSVLEYDFYWIKPSTNGSNWWVKNPTDNTWCVTYKVTTIVLYGGDTIHDNSKFANSRPRQDTTASIILKPVVETPKIAEQKQIEAGKSPLYQNNPNPFIGSTKIKYTVGIENIPANSTDCLTRLVIYNLSGQLVATLVNENKAPGSYEVEWDASQFTPGVYFYSLQSGRFKDVKKLILMK